MTRDELINSMLSDKDTVAKLASDIRDTDTIVGWLESYRTQTMVRIDEHHIAPRYQVVHHDDGPCAIRYNKPGKRTARVDEVGTLQEAEDMALLLYYNDWILDDKK